MLHIVHMMWHVHISFISSLIRKWLLVRLHVWMFVSVVVVPVSLMVIVSLSMLSFTVIPMPVLSFLGVHHVAVVVSMIPVLIIWWHIISNKFWSIIHLWMRCTAIRMIYLRIAYIWWVLILLLRLHERWRSPLHLGIVHLLNWRLIKMWLGNIVCLRIGLIVIDVCKDRLLRNNTFNQWLWKLRIDFWYESRKAQFF